MRISDWSSDVCSSDLILSGLYGVTVYAMLPAALSNNRDEMTQMQMLEAIRAFDRQLHTADRKSVVSGKSVSVRVDLGGRRIIKKKTSKNSISLETYIKKTTLYHTYNCTTLKKT